MRAPRSYTADVLEIAMVCAGVATICLLVWIAFATVGGGGADARRRVEVAASVTFGAIAIASLALFRLVVTQASRESGPLPIFVFFGVPLGLGLAWLTLRLGSARRAGQHP